jgi:tape measure domain-containing protein
VADDLKISINLTGSSSGATAAIDNVSKSLNSLKTNSESTDSAFGNLAKSLATGLAISVGSRALDAVAAAMGSVKSAAIDLNSNLEQNKIAFTTMLGSAQKADDFLRQLSKFANETPFEFPELEQAAKKMLAFGIESKDVVPTLTAVGNAAAALGTSHEGMDRITTALGQMTAKTKVQAEEMMQLTEAGIPAWDFLAKKLNTTVADAMDKVTKKQVDSATFMDAFRTGTAARFGDMMSKQAQTYQGAMSTIHDSLNMLAATGFKPLFDAISKSAQEKAKFLSTDEVQAWGPRFAASLQVAMNALGQLKTSFIDTARGIATAVQPGIGLVQEFGTGLNTLARTMTVVVGEVARQITTGFGPLISGVLGQFALMFTGTDTGSMLGSVQKFVTDLPSLIARAPAAIAAALQDLPRTTQNIINTVLIAWNTNIDAINAGANRAVDFIRTSWQTIQSTTQTVWTAVSGFFTSTVLPAFEGIRLKAGEVKDWLVAQWPTVQTTFQTVATALQTAWTGTVQPALVALLGKFGEVKDWVIAQWPTVQTTFETVGTALAAAWNGPISAAFTALAKGFNDLKEWVAAQWPTVQSTWETVATAIAAAWDGPISQAFTALSKGFNDLQTWVATNWPKVQTAWETVATAIKAAWDGPLAGAFQGLQNAFTNIKTWVDANWANWAAAVIKGFTDAKTLGADILQRALTDLKQGVIDLDLELAKRGVYNDLVQSWINLQNTWATTLFPMLQDFMRDLGLARDAAGGDDGEKGLAKGLKFVSGSFRDITAGFAPLLEGFRTLGEVLTAVQKVSNETGLAIHSLYIDRDLNAMQQHADKAMRAFDDLTAAMGRMGQVGGNIQSAQQNSFQAAGGLNIGPQAPGVAAGVGGAFSTAGSAVSGLFSANGIPVSQGGTGVNFGPTGGLPNVGGINAVAGAQGGYFTGRYGSGQLHGTAAGAYDAAPAGTIADWIAQGERLAGVGADWTAFLTRRIMIESGGDPNIFNDNDVNFQRGTPSIGILQTIGPTFAQYKVPGFDDIQNPVGNIAAAIRYVQGEYGGYRNVPSSGGYAGGGMVSEPVYGMTVSGRPFSMAENGPEWILNRDQMATVGQGGNTYITVQGIGLDEVAAEIERRLTVKTMLRRSAS